MGRKPLPCQHLRCWKDEAAGQRVTQSRTVQTWSGERKGINLRMVRAHCSSSLACPCHQPLTVSTWSMHEASLPLERNLVETPWEIPAAYSCFSNKHDGIVFIFILPAEMLSEIPDHQIALDRSGHVTCHMSAR